MGGIEGNVFCKCFFNVYFGILCINRLKEIVYYVIVKLLIFYEYFIIFVDCKEGNFIYKYLNNYLVGVILYFIVIRLISYEWCI